MDTLVNNSTQAIDFINLRIELRTIDLSNLEIAGSTLTLSVFNHEPGT
jgi:hypothetical protein